MSSVLDLSADQEKQVEAILARRLSAIHEIKQEIFPRVQEQFDGMKEEVAATLDDKQKMEWNEHTELIERIMSHGHRPNPHEAKRVN